MPPVTVKRLIVSTLFLIALGSLWAPATAGATPPKLSEWKTVYSNPLRTAGQQAEIKTPASACKCRRMTPEPEFKFRVIDRRRKACIFDAPAAGEDLVASVKGKLFGRTPARLRQKAYLSLGIRSSRFGVRYRIRVYPRTGRYILSAQKTGTGRSAREGRSTINGTEPIPNGRQVSGIERNFIQGVGKRMRFGLRIYSGRWGIPRSRVRVVALLEGRAIVAFGVPWPNMDRGSISFGAGTSSGGSARGVTASFRDLKVTRALE